MSESGAKYRPDMQVMILPAYLEAALDEKQPDALLTASEKAFIFHEWIHYLHNISTIHGLASLSTLLKLWSNFRYIFWRDGASDDEPPRRADMLADLDADVRYMAGFRSAQSNDLPEKLHISEVQFTEVNITSEPLGHGRQTVLVCEAEVKVPVKGEPVQRTVRIGTHEILESAAYQLEELFALALGEALRVPPYAPYFLVQSLAKAISPRISQRCVLLATLAALQFPDPPQKLVEMLRCGEAACITGEDGEAAVRTSAIELFERLLPEALATLKMFEEAFDKDERMTYAVHRLTATLRKNLAFRKDDLFFELEFVATGIGKKQDWIAARSRYGAPMLFLESKGDEHCVQKDKVKFLAGDPANDKEALAQRKLLYATFHYMYAYLSEDYKSGEPNPKPSRCPFYTSCGHELRIREPRQCASTPWLSLQDEESYEVCEYGIATSKFLGGGRVAQS
ncbi:hypothetical protein [Paraburkholderia strydomiana]|uniref:hypothetical protein n=1 Tax=Paraburkholderia strydomiana TaxID=1245417 RepID=UPI002857D8C9|nr:hypothetical protein [Paraburkholderia strydomiana]MDR7007015.1 hypothetical protein [Paraburkholderia strydomiana]